MALSHHKLPAHKVDGLNGPFDECFFSEKVNQPKASAFGLDSGHVFHDFFLFISRIHIRLFYLKAFGEVICLDRTFFMQQFKDVLLN